MAEPRIYVACLAAYNNGTLHGRWIDADQDSDSINEEIQEMLAESPIPGAEEYAIHDYEGFGELRIEEYSSIEYVSVVAQAMAEHDGAMAAWLANDRPHTAEEAENYIGQFEDAYLGEWSNLEEYADDYLEQTGAHKALEDFSASVRVDVAGFARDLELSGDVWTASSPEGVYVFNNH
jgi:antirestriction protein